jgi:hypothetical protein
MQNNQSYLYNLFLYMLRTQMPCAVGKHKTLILNKYN